MDTDWCLNCNRHIDSSDAYCSEECKNWAGPSTSVHPSYKSKFLPTQSLADEVAIACHPNTAWADHGRGGISAWAFTIPEGPPVRESTVEGSSSFPTLTSRSLYRPPKLLRLQRPVSPSVCMSTLMPTTPPPSQPVSAPQLQTSPLHPRSMESTSSMDQMSSWSSITESPIATPSTAASRSLLDRRDTTDQAELLQKFLKERKPMAHHVLSNPSHIDTIYVHLHPPFW